MEHSYFALWPNAFPKTESSGFLGEENRHSCIESVNEASELKAKTSACELTECTTQRAFKDQAPPSGEGSKTQCILTPEHLHLSKNLMASSTPIFDLLLYGYGSYEFAEIAYREMGFSSPIPPNPKSSPSPPPPSQASPSD